MPTPASHADAPAAAPRGGGFPWAGLLTVLAVLLLDGLLAGPGGPWSAAAARLPGGTRDILGGLAESQVSRRQLEREPGDARARVVLLGSSRGEAAWRDAEPTPEQLRPDIAWVHAAHPGVEPFQMRSQVSSLIDARPDVVVLLLSAFDTHRPVRLVHRANGDDLGAVFELAAALGPAIAWRERTALLRFLLVTQLKTQRFRDVFARAFLRGVAEFDLGRGAARRGEPSWPIAIPGGEGRRMTPAQFERVAEVVRRDLPRLDAAGDFLLQQLGVLQAITVGAHADVQARLVRSCVRRLADAGCDVILLEGPLCPLPVPVHDLSPDLQFRALARELAARPEVQFVDLEASGPFAPSDFRDLVHVDAAGASKLSAATVAAVDAALARRAAARAEP